MKELKKDILPQGESHKNNRVCIITPDIFGPIKNGGIGTAYFHLAVFLRRQGHDVTVCFVNKLARNSVKMLAVKKFYKNFGIRFSAVIPEVLAKTEMARTMAAPYAAYEWLKENEDAFDIVHVSEWHGAGYVALLAKSLGIAFEAIHFVVKGSSPTLWAAEGNRQFLSTNQQLGWVFMERRSAELADTLVCGSEHLLTWMADNKYILPERSFFWPNVFLEDLVTAPEQQPVNTDEVVREWVFFGRLEPRKGIVLFVNALNVLARKGVRLPSITFLGGVSQRFDAQRFIESNSENWGDEVNFISNFDSLEAVSYLRQPGRLAVIPALRENSPIAVYECLAAGIPFIAANTGGTGELLDPSEHGRVLFEPDHLALANLLERHNETLPARARKHTRVEKSLDVWVNWHKQVFTTPDSQAFHDNEGPLVSICVVHFERPDLLPHALSSIYRQTYKNIEIIVVDDGSSTAAALDGLKQVENNPGPVPVNLIYQENRYVGAARNRAAKAAKGEFLLFFDDDNVMLPDMVEKLVKASTYARLDCITCSSIRFTGEGDPLSGKIKLGTQIRFVGPASAWAAKVNVVGDATCLVRRNTFDQIGGYAERYRSGRDDIEFYNKIISSGMSISYYPDPLYYYRIHPVTMKAQNQIMEEAVFCQALPFLNGKDVEEKSYLLQSGEFGGDPPKNHKHNRQNLLKKIFQNIHRFLRVRL